MATMADVPPEYDNITSLDDQRKRPGPGIAIREYGGAVTLVDDPTDMPDLPDNVGVDTVVIERARFERLRAIAHAWVSEGASNGEGWDAAFMRANLQPGDLDPIP